MLNKNALVTIFMVINIIAIIGFFQSKHYNFAFEAIIITMGVLLLTYLDKKKNLPISKYLLTMVLISISGHTIGGELFGFYKIPSYDKFLHILGSYSFSLLGYILLGFYSFTLPNKTKFIMIILIGLSLGTIYELWEFASDQLIKSTPAAQPSLLDTDRDLLANLTGSFWAALGSYKRQ